MRTIDVLIAARARLSNRRNWTAGMLKSRRPDATDGHCFCALGATLKEGGLWRADADGALKPVAHDIPISSTSGLGPEYGGERAASSDFIRKVEGLGFAYRATARALKYLEIAARDLGRGRVFSREHDWTRGNVYNVNDGLGYDVTLQMFDLAIKRAKRRHINGDKKKAVSK